MNNITTEELKSVLVDVRKAYRLLYFYQRRVLDTIKYIGDSLGQSVDSGWALFSSNAPADGKRLNPDRWAWDWLNMYMYEFYFGRQENKGNVIQFAVTIQSDTGGYDGGPDLSEVTVESFCPVELAASRFIFIVGKNRWKADDFLYNSIFSKDGPNLFIENAGIGSNEVFIAKSYPVEIFIDETSIQRVVKDFVETCKNNGVPEFGSKNNGYE